MKATLAAYGRYSKQRPAKQQNQNWNHHWNHNWNCQTCLRLSQGKYPDRLSKSPMGELHLGHGMAGGVTLRLKSFRCRPGCKGFECSGSVWRHCKPVAVAEIRVSMPASCPICAGIPYSSIQNCLPNLASSSQLARLAGVSQSSLFSYVKTRHAQ